MTQLVQTVEERQTEALRVLLVDDHDLFRTGLRNLLEEQGLDIVGEAATGAEAVAHVREITPDVVVMDLNMPSMGGVEATRHIAEVSPLTRVVMLTISDEDSDVTDAILAGACGYLMKDASIEELMAGIRAAAIGESLISSHIAGKVLQRRGQAVVGGGKAGPLGVPAEGRHGLSQCIRDGPCCAAVAMSPQLKRAGSVEC